MKLKQAAKNAGNLLKETFWKFITVRGLSLSAALSCYILLSLIPLLFIIISIVDFFLARGRYEVRFLCRLMNLLAHTRPRKFSKY